MTPAQIKYGRGWREINVPRRVRKFERVIQNLLAKIK